jgi:hypothetical protein
MGRDSSRPHSPQKRLTIRGWPGTWRQCTSGGKCPYVAWCCRHSGHSAVSVSRAQNRHGCLSAPIPCPAAPEDAAALTPGKGPATGSAHGVGGLTGEYIIRPVSLWDRMPLRCQILPHQRQEGKDNRDQSESGFSLSCPILRLRPWQQAQRGEPPDG